MQPDSEATHMFENQFDNVAQHEMVFSQLAEQFTESFLLFLE